MIFHWSTHKLMIGIFSRITAFCDYLRTTTYLGKLFDLPLVNFKTGLFLWPNIACFMSLLLWKILTFQNPVISVNCGFLSCYRLYESSFWSVNSSTIVMSLTSVCWYYRHWSGSLDIPLYHITLTFSYPRWSWHSSFFHCLIPTLLKDAWTHYSTERCRP